MGDQGIQFNLQELQYISQHRLPIAVIICNNSASDMMRDSERMKGYEYPLLTTYEADLKIRIFIRLQNPMG